MRPLVEFALRLVDSSVSVRYSAPHFLVLTSSQFESFCEKTCGEKSQSFSRCQTFLLRSPTSPHSSSQRLDKRLKDAQAEEINRKKLEKAERDKERQKEEYDRLSAAAKEKRDLKNEKKKRQEENAKLMKLVKK
jgi:hypothetical protein